VPAAGARRLAASELHLTLAFIGAVPQELLDPITQAVCIPSARVELALDRFEVWKGGTAVLQPTRVPEAIVELRGRLTASLRVCGVPFDARPFAPPPDD